MDKSGNGNGVSPSGDSAGADGAADDGADPEVTAITRKLNDTGDTLGAIQELEQLIIKRTGAIPIIRLAQPATGPAPEAQPATEVQTEPAPAPESQPAAVSAPGEPEADETDIDWSLPAPPQFDVEPGFSPWVDPDQIAAAQDDEPARSYSDVTTQVFAVFSAPEPEAAPEPQPEPQPQPQPESQPEPDPAPEAEPAAPAQPGPAPLLHLAFPTGSLDVPPPEQLDHVDDDDDVIDDADHAALAGLAPLASVQARVESQPAPAPQQPPQQRPQEPKRRRFWPFGRR